MVLDAGVEADEGVTLTETILGGGDGGFVGGFVVEPEDEVVPPLDTGAFVDCAPLAAEPIPPLHPQPQSARAIRKTKNRKNSDLFGLR